MKKKCLVYSNLDERNVWGIRQSNRTILVPKFRGLVDSDRQIITDKRGHRYKRNIALETCLKSENMIFQMI